MVQKRDVAHGIRENMPREFTIQARYFITFDRVPTGMKFMWLALEKKRTGEVNERREQRKWMGRKGELKSQNTEEQKKKNK